MGKNFIRELSKNYEVYVRASKQETNLDLKQLSRAQALLLRDISKWLQDFSWLRNSETKFRVKCFLDAKFNYKDALEKVNADKKNQLSLNAYKVSINYASDRLKELFGDDFFDVLHDNVVLASHRFEIIKNGNSLAYIESEDVAKSIPDTGFMRFSLNECKEELLFLALFSKSNIKSYFDRVDMNKLQYLKRLLEGKNLSEITTGVRLMRFLQEVENPTEETINKFIKDNL